MEMLCQRFGRNTSFGRRRGEGVGGGLFVWLKSVSIIIDILSDSKI